MYYVISGGVGDFLQCLPFVLENSNESDQYVVVTHFKYAELFFKSLNINVHSYQYFINNEQLNDIFKSFSKIGEASFCPRRQYFVANPLPPAINKFKNSMKILGLHLNGSNYAETANWENGISSKNIPKSIVESLSKFNCNIILFGSPQEIEVLGISENDFLKFSCHGNIIESLSYVNLCSFFIGCDSVFKTMSSMLRIATFVWLPNYADEFRDQIFIDPYVADKIMWTTPFSTLETSTVLHAKQATFEFLKANGVQMK